MTGRAFWSLPMALACLLLFGGPPAAGQETLTERYAVKPSDIALPQGAALGEYRRMTQPFENWVLICDENLKTRQKVCNITQTIVDQAGATAFSWSLAATEGGRPMMILRVPAAVGAQGLVSLEFPDRKTRVGVKTTGCNPNVCVGMTPVDPVMAEQIEKGASPRVSYATGLGSVVVFNAPLKGLATALAAIN